MNMKRISLILLLTGCIYLISNSQSANAEKLMKDFQSAAWPEVRLAKENLENLQRECIPYLIELLNNKSVKKLANTGDLIYPGAEKFYGHGQIIEYDIDKLDIRAGWLLEDLTFQNFGFSGVHQESTALSDFIKFNFPKYYNNSRNRQFVDAASEKEKRELIRKLSTQEAKKWWDSESDHWSRYKGLIEALKSDDERRQARALFYLRNGKTACDNLNAETFVSDIKPLVAELANSRLKRVSEQAKLILVDTDYDWLTIKPSR